MKLLMSVHCHQPVGNFDHIFKMAFHNAYLPFLDVLEKHPAIKISLHYSGSLLDWIEDNNPEFIRRIKKLVEEKQVEILSAGYYEPILILLPEEDRIGQIKLLNEKIVSLWGIKPKGAWLTERVWEPDLPMSLRKADIEYTIVDDTHFEKAGKNREELWGYYQTEYENFVLKIFPGSKFLRYALPFKLPEESLRYLREAYENGRKAITFADDGEKFGLWPGTHKWVYEERWLEKFFSLLEMNSDWLETMNFSEYIDNYPPAERAYLPCASYSEMLDWSGGYFRNFLAKYPEANHMHKRMLEVSRKIQNSKFKIQNLEFEKARHHLYMAQNNDSYWHGVFGGLYLNHLRYSVYTHLLKAENILDKFSHSGDNWLEHKIDDFDGDGKVEIAAEDKLIKIYIDIEEKAGIYELDHREREINLVNTLARRKEKYHEKIREKISQAEESGFSQQGAASIHDIEKTIPKEWSNLLVYDRYRKGCLLEYFLKQNISLREFLSGGYEEREEIIDNYVLQSVNEAKDSLSINFLKRILLDGFPFEVKKKIVLESGKRRINFQYLITNYSTETWEGKLGIEFNFSLWDNLLSISGEKKGIDHLLINDSWFAIEIEINWNKQVDIWHYPVETVYDTETGFEKNYQGLGIFFLSEIISEPHKEWEISGSFEIKKIKHR
ncbi:MAG: alpha-amylase/4-alpha-glucanotransferase domain-containing protein [Candidatus Omnitrophota bacterium]